MICPKCQSVVDENMRFCGECGTPLPEPAPAPAKVFCPECGTPNEMGDAFCAGCGYRLGEPVVEVPVVEVPVVEEIPAPVAEELPVVEEAPAPVAEELPVVEKAAPAKVFCPECGTPNETGDAFCPECGTPLAAPAPAVEEESEFEKLAKETAKKAGKLAKEGAKEAKKLAKKGAKEAKKLAKEGAKQAKKLPKWLLFVIIGVVAVAITIGTLAIFGVFGGGEKNLNYATYLKDGEIYYTEFRKDDTTQITDRLLPRDVIFDGYYNNAFMLSNYTVLTEDGSRMFYPDKISEDSDGLTIYYRDLGRKKDAQKLDSNITLYAVNGKGNQAIYLKGGDGNLYKSNLKEKEKLASDVSYFHVNEDLSQILYQTYDGDVYLMNRKGEKEKIVSAIDSLDHVSEDLQTLYYTKGGDLYMQEVGQDREKIASEVYNVIRMWETGELYYTVCRTEELNLWQYVEDDMAAQDAVMTEPEYPDYPDWPDSPSWWEYDTDEEYEAAWAEYEIAEAEYYEECERLEEEYNAAYELYWAKSDRDWLREELNNYEETMEMYDLYYFDGKESVLIAENMLDGWVADYALDAPVVAFKTCGSDEDVKVKLSEMSSVWDITDAVYEARYANMDTYVSVSGELLPMEMDEVVSSVYVTNDGKQIAVMGEANEEWTECALYTMDVKNGKLGEAVLVAEDAYPGNFRYLSDNRLVYFKNVNEEDETGDLFIGDKEVDFDVYLYELSYNEMLDAVLYYTDYKDGKGGTLKMITGKEPVKVSDDVYDYSITGTGELFFLYDFSDRNFTGELYLYGNKNQRIDDDVSALMYTCPTGTVVGYNYYW